MNVVQSTRKAIDWHVRDYRSLQEGPRKKLWNAMTDEGVQVMLDITKPGRGRHGEELVLMAGEEPFGYVLRRGNAKKGFEIRKLFVSRNFGLRKDFVRRFRRAPSDELVIHAITEISNAGNTVATSAVLPQGKATLRRLKRAFPDLKMEKIGDPGAFKINYSIDYSGVLERMRPAVDFRH